MSRPWLVAIDRQAWPLWLELIAAASPVPSAELAEGYRLVELDRAIGLPELFATGLVRWAIPVAAQIPVAAGAKAIFAQLASLVDATAQVDVFALRRHGRFLSADIREQFPAAGREPVPSNSPRLHVAVGDEVVLAGIASARELGTEYPGGRPQYGPETDQISRARFKIREALAWLELNGEAPPPGSLWIDMGAFPGGMTAELAARGYRVLAVDLATPSPLMRSLPGVVCIEANAVGFMPPEDVDAILCDMNGPPHLALSAVTTAMTRLRPGGWLVLTLKLPHWEDLPRLRDRTTRRLTELGMTIEAVRHLWHNRQEVTVLAKKMR